MVLSIVQILEDSRQELISAAANVSDAHASTAPEAQWSALQCLEHVTFVENRFVLLLEMADRLEHPRSDKARVDMFGTRVADRSNKVTAPEAARPKGLYTSLPQALEAFEAVRARTIQFAQAHADHLDSLFTKHPRFGEVTGTELLSIIAAHARRHAAQIRETVAALKTAP